MGPAGSMKCGSDDNFTNLFLADGKYQNLSTRKGGLSGAIRQVQRMTGYFGERQRIET
jgi:hypothetical protein